METMKGKRWKTLIQQEKAHYHELSSQPHVSRMAHQMKDELERERVLVLLLRLVRGARREIHGTERDAGLVDEWVRGIGGGGQPPVEGGGGLG